MDIRRARPGDHPAIACLLDAAFGGPDEARLAAGLRRSGAAAIECVAVEGGECLGHVLLSWLLAPAGWLALAPLAVRPDRQRRGIGTALTLAALDAARAATEAVAVVVLGDPAYYGRFGFSVAAAGRLATPYPAEFTGLLALRDGVAGRAARLIYPTAFAEV